MARTQLESSYQSNSIGPTLKLHHPYSHPILLLVSVKKKAQIKLHSTVHECRVYSIYVRIRSSLVLVGIGMVGLSRAIAECARTLCNERHGLS